MDRNEIIKQSEKNVQNVVNHQKVLFITTKELDYIRNVQEINLLKSSSSELKVIGSYNKKYVIRLIKIYLSLLITKSKNFDLIFIGFAPQLILPFWKLKFSKKCIVIDFFISMYDTYVNDRKKFKEGSIFAGLLKYLDRRTLSQADKIICDTNAHGKYFSDDLGADSEKLLTLYLDADTSTYYPRKVDRPDKLKGKFIVLYFGSVLPLQGVDVVLEAYNLLKKDDRFYFYMIGPVDDTYNKPESENIEYIQWLQQKELANYIAMADLCLAGHFNNNISKAKRTIPGKAYIYNAMGKKMILGDNEANRELFDDMDQMVFFVKMGNPSAIAGLIREIGDEILAGDYQCNNSCL